jgi:hypothetical protein
MGEDVARSGIESFGERRIDMDKDESKSPDVESLD